MRLRLTREGEAESMMKGQGHGIEASHRCVHGLVSLARVREERAVNGCRRAETTKARQQRDVDDLDLVGELHPPHLSGRFAVHEDDLARRTRKLRAIAGLLRGELEL